LVDGGYFCIEVRGQKNEIYQLGTKVHGEEHAYIYNEHYRRFLNFNELCLSLQSLNFTIEYAAEQKGFAPYEGNDETYIRVIVKK
jgi:tellurite methyltransferase